MFDITSFAKFLLCGNTLGDIVKNPQKLPERGPGKAVIFSERRRGKARNDTEGKFFPYERYFTILDDISLIRKNSLAKSCFQKNISPSKYCK